MGVSGVALSSGRVHCLAWKLTDKLLPIIRVVGAVARGPGANSAGERLKDEGEADGR